MKQFLTLLFTLHLLIHFSFAQDLQPKSIMQVSLAADFNGYFQAIEEQDFDMALDYVFPGLFDLIPRDFMQESMEMEASEGEHDIQIKNAKIQPVSKIIEDEMYYYAMISYSYMMEIRSGMEDDWGELEEDEDWGSESLNVDDFRRKYGVKNVFYDANKQIIRVKMKGNMIAVQSKDEFEDDGWKFIDLKDDMASMADQLIPPIILSKLKS